MSEEKVQYDKRQIIGVLRDLNQMVVSLDRIGSEYGELPDRKSDEELNSLLADFIFGWDLFGKLSNARYILEGAFSNELGTNDMDELEKEFQDLEYWSINIPSPPKNSDHGQ